MSTVTAIQPIDDSAQVDRRRGKQMLQVHLSQSHISAATQPETSRPLRDGPFDPGALLVLGLEFIGGLSCSGRFKGFILGLWSQRDDSYTAL